MQRGNWVVGASALGWSPTMANDARAAAKADLFGRSFRIGRWGSGGFSGRTQAGPNRHPISRTAPITAARNHPSTINQQPTQLVHHPRARSLKNFLDHRTRPHARPAALPRRPPSQPHQTHHLTLNTSPTHLNPNTHFTPLSSSSIHLPSLNQKWPLLP